MNSALSVDRHQFIWGVPLSNTTHYNTRITITNLTNKNITKSTGIAALWANTARKMGREGRVGKWLGVESAVICSGRRASPRDWLLIRCLGTPDLYHYRYQSM